jgi:hypothetical protein
VIAGEIRAEQTDGHRCFPLDHAKCMVIARTAPGHCDEDGSRGGFYARVVDGSSWEPQIKWDASGSTGSSDRRFSVAFDGQDRMVHMIYSEGDKQLVYLPLKPFYGPSDWSESSYPV